DQLDSLLDINITADEYPHVIGHIIGVEEILYIYQRRILQMFRRTDGGLLTIGVLLVEQPHQGGIGDPVLVVQRTIEFFIDGFKFGMEQTEYWIYKAF